MEGHVAKITRSVANRYLCPPTPFFVLLYLLMETYVSQKRFELPDSGTEPVRLPSGSHLYRLPWKCWYTPDKIMYVESGERACDNRKTKLEFHC
ncbi:hypothetical protein RRG08_021819 [Elysia crispata]|uniref:Uncharacterized protein n=1 Tax=Elysia crispata TaxID=231223 RepID=A0AAE0ZY44_9GAST|nr:hypothetical protein RRG08_021819 [Elysia crispata]